MENQEKSNPVLRILKNTKFGITESVVQRSNMLTYSSSLRPFLDSMKDIGANNCILPEKLVKYKVCSQNNFRSKSKQLFDDIELRPISSSDIECLEREIQDNDGVLAEKRKVLQSLRNDLAHLQEEEIPKAEDELKSQTRAVEVNLANFFELNAQLSTQHNALSQSKQKLLQTLRGESKEGNDDSMYHKFDFKQALYHLLDRMNTDFNVLCKYLNSSSNQAGSSNVDLEVDIELIAQSLSQLRTQIEMAKCKNHAQAKCEERLLLVKQQLEGGVFKFNMLETGSSHRKSSQQLQSDLATAWSKISSKHSEQTSRTTSPALHRLCQIQVSSLESRISLLTNLATGMNCMLRFKDLLMLFVHVERDSYQQLFRVLYETHGAFDNLYSSLIKQETKLKQILMADSSRSKDSKETTAETYAKELIAQSIRLHKSESLECALQSLESKLKLGKQRIQDDYCMENVYRKLAPLRQSMKLKEDIIYGGPTQVPVFPYREHNEMVHSRILHLSKLKVEYANLQQEIKAGSNNEAMTAQSSLSKDSGIESQYNLSV